MVAREEDDRRAAAAILVKNRTRPELSQYFQRLKPFLRGSFQYTKTTPPEFGQVLLALADNSKEQSYFARFLPAALGESADGAIVDSLKQEAAAETDPSKRFSMAQKLIRKGQLKDGVQMLLQVEEALPARLKPYFWRTLFTTLKTADRNGGAAVTRLAAAGEDPAQQVVGKRNLHHAAQEPDLGIG